MSFILELMFYLMAWVGGLGIGKKRVLCYIVLSIQCIILKFHLCFQVGADGWKEECTNIFQGKSHYYWSLGINFRAYAKMVKVDCLRKRIPTNTIFIWNATNFTFAALPKRKHYGKRNGGVNVYSQGMASMTRMWKRGRME